MLRAPLLLIFVSIFTNLCNCWPGYQILTERTEIAYNDLEYVKVIMKTGKFNRTTMASNMSAYFYKTVPKLAVVTIIGYEWKSNEYRRSSIHVSRYVCDYLDHEYKMFFKKTMDKLGKVPQGCPIEKGHYYYSNFIMDPIYVPFKPIGERWMMEGNLTYNNITLTSILWYINIVRNSKFYRQEEND